MQGDSPIFVGRKWGQSPTYNIIIATLSESIAKGNWFHPPRKALPGIIHKIGGGAEGWW